MNMLFRVHHEKKLAVEKGIEEAWKAAYDQAQRAWDVQELVEEAIAEKENDERLLQRVLRRVEGDDQQRIEEANRFVQDYCNLSLRIHKLLKGLIQIVGQGGHTIAKAAELDEATRAYEKWKEDYPEAFVMAYRPVHEVIRERINKALDRPPGGSNWQGLFEDEE